MSVDKWNKDTEYVEQIKEEYKKIDKEFEDEELQQPIPETLTKEQAISLLDDKEKALQAVWAQLSQMKYSQGSQGGGSPNVDFD